MIMTSLRVECRETREELVHRKPDRHSESRHHDAEKNGSPSSMQIGNNPEGHNIGCRAGEQEGQGRPGGDPTGEQDSNHGRRSGGADIDRNSKHGKKQDLQVRINPDKPAVSNQRPDQRGHHQCFF